jgi:hypothetical protein
LFDSSHILHFDFNNTIFEDKQPAVEILNFFGDKEISFQGQKLRILLVTLLDVFKERIIKLITIILQELYF